MKPKPAYATLQRKIRRLNANLSNEESLYDDLSDYAIDLKIECRRLSSLLQLFKDKEIDRAHRAIRSNP